MAKKIELFSGPFGAGKTTQLTNKMKEIGADSTDCKFLTADCLVDIKRDSFGVTSFPFEYAQHVGKIGFVFIDDVDIFIEYFGTYFLKEIIKNCNEVYMSAVNSFFYYHYRERDRDTDLMVAILKFVESIPDIKINRLLLKDNTFLPSGYAEALEEEFGYVEDISYK